MRGGTARGLKDDLPDVTSEIACDTLARRANHFVIPGAANGSTRGPAEGCSLLQEGECLLNEGSVVLEDAAVPGVREDAQLCIRQPTGELE
jgi:hypothetical protein